MLSPVVKFAKVVSSGRTKVSSLFLGLIDVFVNGEAAKEDGKKLTGLQYSSEVEAFALNLFGRSTSAYRYLSGRLRLPSICQLL